MSSVSRDVCACMEQLERSGKLILLASGEFTRMRVERFTNSQFGTWSL